MSSLLAQAVISEPGGGGSGSRYLGDMLKVNESGIGVMTRFNSISSFLNLLVPLSFVIAGTILLFLLIGGGFAIISSGGNAKNVESGKNQIMGAVIGFLVIFSAYWVIQIIQAMTGVAIFNSAL